MPTSQIIVTSRYIKSGTKKTRSRRSNYTKYIATRESVEKRPQNITQVSQNQKQLINELLIEFPKAKQFLEYEDYSSKPTAENASELINTIIERYADVIGNRRNFIDYVAKRPGAEKRGEHGLFNNKDDSIDLNAVANEVANHPGNVWTHVVSIRREDAVRLGYTNSDMWRELVKRHIADIAQAQNIPLSDLKWYAAFHDTTHHPHIHMIVYSKNPKKGYLTKQGIEIIRSVFANDIFQDELKSIYQQQTMTRDELKKLSDNQLNEILSEIGSCEVKADLIMAVKKLNEQLKTAKGKKVYGYLPKEIKQTVDEIFSMLAQNEHIAILYEKWCELENLKYKTYMLKPKSFPPLTENKEFKSVKNMIIRSVLKMDEQIIDEQEPNIPESTNVDYCIAEDENQKAMRCMAEEYITGERIKQDIDKGIEILTELADNGDSLSAYKLGKIYFSGEMVFRDYDMAERYLRQASDAENEFAMYTLSKLYLTEERYDLAKAVDLLDMACKNSAIKPYAAYTYAKILLDKNEYHDTQRAVQLLEETSNENNWCSYLLGKVYLYGNDDIEPDSVRAAELLKQSAEDGNKYAENLLIHIDDFDKTILINIVMNLFASLSRIIEEDYNRSQGFCEMKMIPQWRLEMIGEKIIQEIFIDRRGVIEEVIDLIKRCYRKDRKVISRNSDKDNLESIRYLENKLNNLIEMRAGGELTKEQYLEIKAKTEKELSEKRKLIITDSSDNTKLSIDKNLDRIEKTLESVMDSNSEEMTDLLDKIVYMVNVVDERKFIFRLRYDKDRIGSISCETSGRKNFARINLSDTEGASEEVPDIHIIYIKKSCNMQKLCRLQSTKRSNSRLSQNRRFYAVSGRCGDVLQS